MAQAIPNILVVEDDRETRSLIAKYLRNNACNVATAADGREMARAMTDRRVDLLILDVMLPGEDGLTLCRKVRAQSQTPIIMLTARGEDVDRILGLEMGADDYLAKPVNSRELLARMRNILRRVSGAGAPAPSSRARLFRFGGWQLDSVARELCDPQGQRASLRNSEYRVLSSLLAHGNRVVSRGKLIELARGRDAGPFDRSIDVRISRLRQVLGDDARVPRIIKTVHGEGYVIGVPVERG
jgi:two-component system OmpR family response regulator